MVIEKPMFGVGKVTNDYGLGFYCTEHRELACEYQEAKRQFQDELKDKASDGLYMVDILRGKMEADDARLR